MKEKNPFKPLNTDISIIVVNYNVKYFLEQCLYSVRCASAGLNVEVFVVDNASTDGSEEFIRKRFPYIIYIYNSENRGFASANNQVIPRCTGKYILLLNPDTVLGEKTLRSVFDFMENHPEAGGADVKMLNGHGHVLPESKRSFPTPWASFCKLFGLSKMFPYSRWFASYNLLYLDPDCTHDVHVLAGAFMFIRSEALSKAGVLDEAFFMYGEDIDLSYRLRLAGYSNYYLPVPIIHYKGESSKQHRSEYIRNFYGAMLIFFKKYYPDSSKLMAFLIRMAIKHKTRQAAKRSPSASAPGEKDIAPRRLALVCRKEMEMSLEVICRKHIPDIESVKRYELPEKLSSYTDMAFSYPDITFDTILSHINKTDASNITYHIYNRETGRLISPTE
jgi:GT2 family glycosyltransferase